MYKFTAFFLVLLMQHEVFAINLQEALTIAYDNNDELKIARSTFLNEIESFPQALSGFMPRVSASVVASDTKIKGKSQYSKETTESKAVKRGLSIEQPIYTGGSSLASLKAAQSSFRSARGAFYASEQKTLLSLIDAYLKCYENEQKYSISSASVESSKKQLESTEVRLKLGESTETELAKAKSQLAISETNRLKIYAELQASKANFVRLFGIEPTDITKPDLPSNLPSSLEELLQKATLANPSIESVRHAVTAYKANESVAKAALLPQVSFNVTTNRSYYDKEKIGDQTTNNRGLTSSLSMQIPIYAHGGAEYSKIREAKNKTRKSSIELNEQIKRIYASSIGSWESFNAAKSGITASAQGVEAGQIAYDGTVQEEIVGNKMILEVLEAQKQLDQAKTQNVEANVAYISNAYQMKALIGELTAKSLKLKGSYFSPENEFKKIKSKLIGF
jgi:outer membrane protein